jgi:endonuclease YncB( thermonuclease family)
MNLFFLLGNIFIFSDKMICWNFIKRHNCFKFKHVNSDAELNNSLHGGIQKKSYYEYLNNIEYKDTQRFIPQLHYVKVIKVYDGDTITVASKIPDTNLPIYRFSVRLRNIDSPEIKGHTETEKKLAIVSRDALRKLIGDKIIILKNIGIEKYGRLLADIYLDDLYVNDWMLENNYAIPYDGGKKLRPDDWE